MIMEGIILGEYSLSPDTAVESAFPLGECWVQRPFNISHAFAKSCTLGFCLPPDEYYMLNDKTLGDTQHG